MVDLPDREVLPDEPEVFALPLGRLEPSLEFLAEPLLAFEREREPLRRTRALCIPLRFLLLPTVFFLPRDLDVVAARFFI